VLLQGLGETECTT